MPSVYAVSYDLNKAGQNYSGLIAELQRSDSWWHYLKSTWLIYTNESADQLWTRISSHIDANDFVLIIKVQPGAHNRSGWLTQPAWDWMTKHVG